MTTQLNVVRIKKLTADSGKGATDALINTALTKFQNGQSPDVIFMNLRSLGQLQASRTATSPTGSGVITQTGAGGAGAAADEKTIRIPPDCKRYLGIKTTNSGAGDASDVDGTLELVF